MEFISPARAMPLHQAPVASVFGYLEGEKYIRFLKLPVQNIQGVLVVSLALSIDAELTGPSATYLDEDLTVYVEAGTSICPKITASDGTVIDPSRNRHIPVGAFVIGNDDDAYLYVRANRGDRALVNLATGITKGANSMMAFYEHYLLLAKDELGKPRIIFDSSKEIAARVAA